MGSYLNHQDLADALASAVRQLRQAQGRGDEPAHSVRSSPSSTRQWQVDDRLSEADQERLIADFVAGTSKRKLAERYGISESSVKRLVREHGASKPSGGLSSDGDGTASPGHRDKVSECCQVTLSVCFVNCW
jgi:FixJ family two-component response regulator